MIDFGFDHINQIFAKLFVKKKLVPRKKVENSIFLRGKYLPNISLSCIVRKYLQSFFRTTFNWTPQFHLHPFHSLLELQLILVKILLLLKWVSTRTQISNKSETDFKYFCLKYMNCQKNGSQGVIFFISGFQLGLTHSALRQPRATARSP